jgi:ribonuclease E
MKKEMLINVLQPEETRVAILEDGVLEELYVERVSVEINVGNIYKGRIVNIEPSIQAAFVDFGVGRNGFLHISDVSPQYFSRPASLEEVLHPIEFEGDEDTEFASPESRAAQPAGAPRREARGEPSAAPASRPERDRSRRRRRGRRRHDEAHTPASSQPAAASPDALPDLEELRFDDAYPADQETLEADTEAAESPEPIPEVASDSFESEDAFGAGILDDEPDDRPPTQRAVYRRTDPPNDDDSEFGRGLDENFEPTGEFPDDVDEPDEEGPEPRQERYDDSDLEPWGEIDVEEPDRPTANGAAAPEIEGVRPADERTPFGRGRGGQRRRRGRRGRSDDEQRHRDHDAPRHEPIASEPKLEVDESRRDRSRPRSPRDRFRSDGFRRPRQRPLIQDVFRKGQEVLVQVIKEGIGNKGPTLSTYLSIPGRYLVLMPGMNRVGVSRKIVDEAPRRALRQSVLGLNRPKGVGVIIRTAGLDRTQQDLERDLNYLVRLWEVVRRRMKNQKAPAVVYQESDMIIRTIRDIYSSDVDTIWIDEPASCDRAREFLQLVMPRQVSRLKLYSEPAPLFHHFGIEDEIAKIQQRTVPLPAGGSIVVDQTEALVAIDVNSGNFRAEGDAEETAFQINLAAAKEIARQLRLRDLGGVIVNDFIDMREERHRRGVERALREAVRRDRARTKILRMSAFGIIEMTRQRIRPSLRRSLYRDCPMCTGMGHIKTVESVAIDCMRTLTYVGQKDEVRTIRLIAHPDVAEFLQNHKRRELARIEDTGDVTVTIVNRESISPQNFELECFDADGVRINDAYLSAAPRP